MVTYFATGQEASFPVACTHSTGHTEFLVEDLRLRHIWIMDESKDSIQTPVNFVFSQMSVL